MAYKITCPQCPDWWVKAKNVIEAKYYRNKHIKEFEHWDCEFERVS